MNKLLLVSILFLTVGIAKAQDTIPSYQPYGKVNMKDLEMKTCEFEKDANAEVLISKGNVYYDQNFNVGVDYHKRIKIFNDEGKRHAGFKLMFMNFSRKEHISDLQAETINLVDGKPEITKLDKKLVYTQVIDKYYSEMVFTMPNIKPGSIIDVKYTITTNDPLNIPEWYFQDELPVRFSEYDTAIPEYFIFQSKTNSLIRYAQHITSTSSGSVHGLTFNIDEEKRVLVNLHSLNKEPFMSSVTDNLLNVHFSLASFKPPIGFIHDLSNTWSKLGENLIQDEDFGAQMRRSLKGEDEIINKAKTFKTDDEKIIYLFNTVKNEMKWNDIDSWYTINGTSDAWNKKTGNSTEINLILYHFLYKSGVTAALPMLVSTREHGKVNPDYTFLSQFNRAVVYIPVDSTRKYILDASNKYNIYNEIPYKLLNSFGFYLNKEDQIFSLIFLEDEVPVRQSIFIDAEIKPDGKINGNAKISSLGYNRIAKISEYKKEGEKIYIESLKENDNNLSIHSLKMDNLEVDSLPLVENLDFNLDLSSSDNNYIYFNSNLFSSLHKNPFLSETRNTNIDFGFQSSLIINGIYKEPAGYNVDGLPKNIIMTMPDKGITFKRIINEQDGSIIVRYTITYNKSLYFKEDYANFHEFFKQLFQNLNEPIVLKKS